MKNEWRSLVINKIGAAVYVPPNTGKHIHKNRPFHGFVLNGSGCVRDYCFSDGSVLHTEGHTLFYLPRGSSYEVKTISGGGCYAINFDADIVDAPFLVNPKNAEQIQKSFKRACNRWINKAASRDAFAMSALYDAIGIFADLSEQEYLPSTAQRQIKPALDAIEKEFSNADLTVEYLSSLCEISEVYLRKLFMSRFGISPKEYIIHRRMDYACHLLSSGQFEVSDVALLCGYTEPCHFSREFKKRIGISPKDYI